MTSQKSGKYLYLAQGFIGGFLSCLFLFPSLFDFPWNYIFKQKQPDIPVQFLKAWSEKVTVKVSSKTQTSAGSGVLFDRKNNTYQILTNNHVVENQEIYTIRTYDNQTHNVKIVKRYKEDDLAILEFLSSDKEYEVVSLSQSSNLTPNDKVYAVGFPRRQDNISFLEGFFTLILNKPLVHGYQIGYSIDVKPGMSGGPLLNDNGELIGLNGKLSNPVKMFEGSKPLYINKDGTSPDVPENILRDNSWAIPTETIAKLLPNDIELIPTACKMKKTSIIFVIIVFISFTSIITSCSRSSDDLVKISSHGKQITVRLKIKSQFDKEWQYRGTGVIIHHEKKANTYYVLTASHSVPNPKDNQYKVITSDNNEYSKNVEVLLTPITDEDNKILDAAIISFKSPKKYEIAKLKNTAEKLDTIYIFGWPKEKVKKLVPGKVYKYDLEVQVKAEESRNMFLYFPDNSKIEPKSGMSGGPIFDIELNVIGIHTNGRGLDFGGGKYFKGVSIKRLFPTIKRLFPTIDESESR